ncbi:hypothetical protein G7046_g1824 [Stylonectria norvegica]|nr:hypothetical protein G7046_g1824 [Stylonectria norvegica]
MSATTTTTADKPKSYIPVSSSAHDGWSNEDEATASCYCGAVQLAFPIKGPGLIDTFICNCTDCRKITASMFASNFVITDASLKHLRGKDNLTIFKQSKTIASGAEMSNHFCSTCGTLMYRLGASFKGMSILRIGTVDDFSLHDTILKPRVSQYTKNRVAWLHAIEGIEEIEGSAYN